MENHESYLRTTNTRNSPSLDSPNTRLNQRRIQKQTNQRDNYEQRTPRRNYYLSENDTHPKNTRTVSTKNKHEDNEYTPMKNLHSEN
jgi:hypothetical protein